MDESIDRLLARKILGCITPDEEAALEEWVRLDVRHARLVQAILRGAERQGERAAETVAGSDAADVDGAWQRLSARIRNAEAEAVQTADRATQAGRQRNAASVRHIRSLRPERPRLRGAPLLRIAAALTVAAAGLVALRVLGGPETGIPERVVMSEAAAPRGSRLPVDLPDGTRVVLAPESRIRYPQSFASASRQVELEGQAYFDVSHDPERPFEVRTPRAVVAVLGTRFVLRAYGREPVVELAVQEGAVALRRREEEGEAVRLGPGDLGRLATSGGRPIVTRGGVTARHVGWLEGRLVFRDAPLSAVFMELSRYYDVEFRAPDALLRRRVSFSLDDHPEAAVLELLAHLLDSSVRKTGGVVQIEPRTRAR